MTAQELDGRGWKASIGGRVEFLPYPDYRIDILEVVDCRRGNDPRVRYTYQLFSVIQGSVWGYHRDPRGHPDMPDHFHLNRDSRTPLTASLYLAEVIEHAYTTLGSMHEIKHWR